MFIAADVLNEIRKERLPPGKNVPSGRIGGRGWREEGEESAASTIDEIGKTFVDPIGHADVHEHVVDIGRTRKLEM